MYLMQELLSHITTFITSVLNVLRTNHQLPNAFPPTKKDYPTMFSHYKIICGDGGIRTHHLSS